MTKPTSDKDELKRLFLLGIGGESSSYREFLQELSRLLRVYVRQQLRRMGRTENDSEDIVQEALMAVHTRRHTYQSDMPVTAWAYAIARYKLIDHLRATTHEARAVLLDEATADVDLTESIDAGLAVRKIVAKLPPALRRPIELIKLEGYSARDVATVTGSSEIAVRVNLHRGLKALSRFMGAAKEGSNENG